MYRMKNEYGNVYKTVKTKEKRDALINLGYKEVEEKKTGSGKKEDSK